MEETVLFHVVQPEDCDNTHETISSYNVFVVYSFICWSSIYWFRRSAIVFSTLTHSRQSTLPTYIIYIYIYIIYILYIYNIQTDTILPTPTSVITIHISKRSKIIRKS